MQKLMRGAVVCTVLVTAVPAWAHEAESLAKGFLGGLTHPLSGPDHLLAMIAVGIWGAFLGRPLIYVLPVVFPTVMAIGGIMGMADTPFPPVEIGIAISVLALGLVILAAWRAPVPIAAGVVGVFALFHGYAHGLELPSMVDPLSFSLGSVIATGLLHVCGIVIGMTGHKPHGEAVLRSAGALIAFAGVWFLASAGQWI